MPRAMTLAKYRRWRFYAEHLVQQTIDVLDQTDGDSDWEAGGDDEPSLAAPAGGESQIIWCAQCDND